MALLRLARGAAPFGEEIAAIEHGLIRLRSGGLRAVVATTSLNFVSLPPEQQVRTVLAFRDLLQAEGGPLQLYVRSRRIPAGDPSEPDPAAFRDQRSYLAAMTQSFITAHLRETAVYARDVFIVLSPQEIGRSMWHLWLDRRDHQSVPKDTFANRDIVHLRERAQALCGQLQHMGIAGRVLQDEDLEQLRAELYQHLNGAVPLVFRHRPASVELQGRHYSSFVVDHYPGGEVEPGWLQPLLCFPGELHVGIHLIPLETDRMLHFLHHKIRDIRADEMADLDSGMVRSATLGTLPDALSVHQALVRNEEKVFAVAFYFTVAAPTPSDLRAEVEAIQTTCRKLMLHAVQPFFQMPQALLASWPLALDGIGRERLLHTSAVTTLLPWLQADLADAEGHYWGYNKETGGLVVFDPFDESRFPNANVAVLAHSGAGKSYSAAALILSGYTRGVGAVVLDPEAEYGRIVRSLGGTYLELAAGSGHAINVLDPLVSPDGAEAVDPLNDVLDLVSLMCGRLDEAERAQLEHAVRKVVSVPGRIPVLGDVYLEVEQTHPDARLTTILRRWVGGELGLLFSAPTNVDLSAEVIGFNLRDLKDEVIAPAYLLLANWLWAALRRDRRPRHLLIDEAGLLLEHEPIRRFLVRLARRVRKYRGSLILVSQNPGDFFETKDGAVLATNPSIILLGSQKHSEALKLQKAFSLTDRQVAYLETAQRGDFLLLAGANRVPVRIMAPSWMDELIVPLHK